MFQGDVHVCIILLSLCFDLECCAAGMRAQLPAQELQQQQLEPQCDVLVVVLTKTQRNSGW
jgi:hypothetical protein